MAKSPGDSKIPVLHANPLKSRISKPLSTLSSRVRAHLDASKSRTSASSVLFGILNVTGGNLKNVNVAKSISSVSPFAANNNNNNNTTNINICSGSTGCGQLLNPSSHDDLKGCSASVLTRPTNLFAGATTTSHVFPSASQPFPANPISGVEHIGSRVRLNSGKEGLLRFVGKTQFGEGLWCGVELEQEEGSSDGTVNSVRYFSCAKNHGLFAPISNVSLVAPATDEVREYLSDVSDSGPHSLLGITGDVEPLQYESGERSAAAPAEVGYFRHRLSGSHLPALSQTPTPNSSTGSFVASCDWKCGGSQHSSSAGSLALSQRGISSALEPNSSIQMSKHSSFEHDESLGILTPDQMGELTTYSNDVTILGGGSCDDLRSLGLQENRVEAVKMIEAVIPPKYPSMENILEVSLSKENDKTAESMLETEKLELVDRLCSEADSTCMMSVSSISDHLEVKEEVLQGTPSLEELPIDELDAMSTTLVAQEQLEVTQVATTAPPTSFVTSVTSIGSWDNGYQGDGECSRPTSRGADASPLARVPKMIAKVLDPMTDSDFYTESDADLYEDVACFRGDRKARVIDGKLFGSPVNTKLITCQSYGTQIFASEYQGPLHERSVPEEMDSSGIFSDLEKRAEVAENSPVDLDSGGHEETHSDTSGQSSSKSVSSQKMVVVESKDESANRGASVVEKKPEPKAAVVKSKVTSKPENSLKRRNETLIRSKESSKSTESTSSSVATKPKIARRAVTSKVKAMIVASTKCCEDENQENRQPVLGKGGSKKLGGRCDSTLLAKVAKEGRSESKARTERLKDVKSKVMCGMPRMVPSKLHKDVKPFSPNGNAMNKALGPGKNVAALSGSTRSLKEASNHRSKSRKIRTRVNQESPVQSVTVSCSKSLSQASSRNSSVTDISDSHVDISQHSLPAVVISAEFSRGKKSSSLLCSPVSEGAVTTSFLHNNPLAAKDVKIATLPRTRISPKPQIGSVNSLVEDSSSAMKVPKKMTYRRTLPKVIPLKDQNRVLHATSAACSVSSKNAPLKPLPDHGNRTVEQCKAAKVKTKSLNQISKINPLLSQLKYATDGMEAFIILFQRLTTDSDVFALPHIKEELSKYKKDWLGMKLKLEEANVSCRRLKEEVEVQKLLHDQKLEELRGIHMAQLDRLNECHSRELGEHSVKYEEQLRDLENQLRHQEQILQAKFDDDLRKVQREAEQKLEGILEETKSQVELLKLENDAWKEKLIKESWRKLQDVEKRFKTKMDDVETGYRNQLDEAEKEAQKREELFLTSMKRKSAATRDSGVHESNSEIGKSSLESSSSHGTRLEYQNLEEEICSLRTVLDLKHSEIQDLRKQNEKLRRETQDLPFVSQKLDSAQARVEDLNAQLQTKIENEKKLLKENRRLLETVQLESEKKKRLTFQNEELLWKLKKSTQVAKTLAVFNSGRSKEERVSESDAMCVHSTPLSHKHHSHSSKRHAEKCLKRSRTDADIQLGMVESPPSDGSVSPKVLGVVEKSDSVSWVLEMDESPMAVASRMLRRANSLRGVPSKKKSQRDQQSLTLPARTKKKGTAAATSPPEPLAADAAAATTSSAPDCNGHATDEELRNCESADATSATADESAITDISSFFDFLHDPDFDTDLLVADDVDLRTHFYMDDKAVPSSPFSNNSSSTDSSLDLETYNHEMKSFTRFTWTSSSTTPTNGNAADPTSPCGPKMDEQRARAPTIDSSSVTDSDDESMDSFPSSGLEMRASKMVDNVPAKQ